MDLEESITRFCEALERHSIRYVIGGSVASGIWGEPRQTNDVDVEVWVGRQNAAEFLSAMSSYLVSEQGLEEALSSDYFPEVQVVDEDSMLRFDCFLQLESDPFATECFERSALVELVTKRPVRVASAGEILLQKLRWYEIGHRVSQRQRRDLNGILRAEPEIEWTFVTRWAERFGLDALLDEIRREAGLGHS
jgi:hypothetical protein